MYIIKGAVQSHLRGYTLTSGSLAPADVSEWLCSAMPATMQPALGRSCARTRPVGVSYQATKRLCFFSLYRITPFDSAGRRCLSGFVAP